MVVAGHAFLVTRRCSQRQFLLRPGALTDAIFRYVLAVAAQRHGVLVHAYCVLSNHYHLVVTDARGRLPAFGQYLDSLVARAVNCSLGRWEHFWDPASYSAVRLVAPRDVIDKTAYVLANPVLAGLVRRGEDWPGLWSGTSPIDGEGLECLRPKVFFDERGSMPASVTLTLTRPPGFGFATTEDFVLPLVEALADLEERAARALRAKGRGFLGRREVLRQRPTGRPASGEPRRVLGPRVAARDRWARIEALQRLTEFVAKYRAALKAWRAGLRSVVFPHGTYHMRLQHGACCEGFG
jgi:REP element-mobilizing transposase RayT